MLTQPSKDIGREVVGYVMNSGFSQVNQDIILDLQEKILKKFPGAVWIQPSSALHITLLDYFAPLVTYAEDKDVLYKRYESSYNQVMERLIHAFNPIDIAFNQIKASSTAVFIQGVDDGSYQRLREGFLEEITLEPGTKPPPQIIHSSIARFINEIPIDDVMSFISTLAVDFTETVTEFRLLRERRVPMLEYQIMRTFHLNKS